MTLDRAFEILNIVQERLVDCPPKLGSFETCITYGDCGLVSEIQRYIDAVYSNLICDDVQRT